jgi:hypothetical protein
VPRLPANAFAQFAALGPQRSYAALARALGVTKRSVSRLATKERWQERLAKIEDEARVKLDEKLGETLQAINARHVKIARAVQAKALQALQSLPLTSSIDAIRALDMAIKHERLAVAEPASRGTEDHAEDRRDAMRNTALEIREAMRAMLESVPSAPPA